MLLKDYQRRALDTVREYLIRLAEMREKDAKARLVDPDLGFDFAEKAWEKMERPRAYLKRQDGCGRPLPSVCLKIPTGGGKTLLAARAVDLINTRYLRRQNGLVLWVVPTTQIYRQTLEALKDRDHPYRQSLDLASAGRTLILERENRFSPADVSENLCILLLMLPAAWRENREQLRMFRDSGGYERFFPGEEDYAGHKALLEQISNLDTFEKQDGFWGRQVKTSLGNTLRLLNPVMIIDEGQKAYSENARMVLESFNPSIMLELSATPAPESNILVDILGRELNNEHMIKLDLHVRNGRSLEWKDTLLAAIEHRKRLEEEAQRHEAETGVYIRPICLIQVERTGKEQRHAGLIHAEDAKEYLLQYPGVRPEHIAIKTSQKDELKEVDEAGGLLTRDCPIRFIITKQALQEGWDCPFAYVLAILTNPTSRTALTQLVGRILRQPYARKTGNAWLDESYVFCFQRRGKELLEEIRRGFGLEGLGDLHGRILEYPQRSDPGQTERHGPREKFATVARQLVLPAFMIRDGNSWRPVHYEADILSRVPWGDMKISKTPELVLLDVSDKNVVYRTGLEETILEKDPEFQPKRALPSSEDEEPDYAFAACHILDVMPNPWRGNDLARKVFTSLMKKHGRQRVLNNFVFIIEELRKELEEGRDCLAQQIFLDLLANGTMRFIMVAEDFGKEGTPNRLPLHQEIGKNERRATGSNGMSYQMSLFEQMPQDSFNELETRVATFLEGQDILYFWYRNAARKDYHVQGWKRNRIFADFVVTLKNEPEEQTDAIRRVFILETKGKHLRHSEDTTYKRDVFTLCSGEAKKKDWADLVPYMRNKEMRFEVVDEDEWEARLNAVLADG